MNNLNLYHLKYFVDAAAENSVSQSARKNFLSQSAVSRAIATLEKDLGVELVIHKKNHFQLTEAGQAVFEMSQPLFEKVSELRNAATLHLDGYRGPLRFACNQAVASHLIGPILSKLELKHPLIQPEIRLGNTDQVQRMTKNGEVDFGIVVEDGEVENLFSCKRIFTDELILVKSPKLKSEDLTQYLLVSRLEKGSFSQRLFKEYRKLSGLMIKPKLTVPSWQVILDLAIAGYGIALIPRFICKEGLSSKKLVVSNPRLRPIPFSVCTIVNGNRALPKNAKPLLDLLD